MAISEIQIPVGSEVFDARAAGPPGGELVLLLHGFPQTSWSWRHQLEALAAAGYYAVAPDQRGYSPDARPESEARYGTIHLANDVLATAYELGGHHFHLVGHDWGAAVAWQVAGRHAERVKTLTAVSVPHPLAFTSALRDEGGDQSSRSSYIDFFRSDGAAEALLADDAAMLRGLYESTGLPPEDVAPYLDVLTQPGAMQAALNWYRAADLTLVEGLGPITMPTMHVWSTDDPALGRAGAEATADHVEGPYRFEVLEGVGHWIPELAAEQLNRLLLEHLSSHR